MAVCGNITANLGFNCPTPLVSGTRDRMWIMDHAEYELATKTFAVGNAMVLTDVVLAGIATAFYVEGKNNSNAPSFALVKQTYGDVYDHMVNFLGFDLTNAAKEALDTFVGGRYVVAIENSFKGATGESAFELLGAGSGMEIKVFTRDALNNDNQGAYVINLGTPEIGKEAHMPYAIFDTDYATTRAMLEGLL